MPKVFAPIALIILLLFNGGCLPALVSSGPEVSTPAPIIATTPQGLLDAAEAAYNRGNFQEAVDNYQRYLQSAPTSPRLPAILASYGLAAEKAGLFSQALNAYQRLTTDFPQDPFAAEAQLRLAEINLAAGDAALAAKLAQQNLETEKNPANQAALTLTLAQAQWVLKDYRAALTNFLSVWGTSTGQLKVRAQEGVVGCLTRLDQETLGEIQLEYGQKYPADVITYLMARQAVQDGDKEWVTAQAGYFTQAFPQSALAPQMALLVQTVNTPSSPMPPLPFADNYNPIKTASQAKVSQSIPATMGNLNRLESLPGDYLVALVLPLSAQGAGKYAQEVAAGLNLAIENFAPGRLGVQVMDTKGSPEEAARLVKEAAANPKILAVVGPFLSRETTLAAQAAQKARLPLIAISQSMDITNLGSDIFRIFLTPKHQAEAVARYAIQVQGHQTLGILYPDDNFGRPVRGYFEDEVNRLGARVTVADSYDPENSDWNEAVTRLTGGKGQRQADSSYQAETGFTALYLPDSAATVSQILPQMAFHDVTRMQYLGSPLWLNQSFLAGSARYIQGAVVPAAISDLSQRSESRYFIDTFVKANQRQPDQFAAYGYDAGLAIIKALGQGATSRSQLRQALTQNTPVPGATGPFVFNSKGEYIVEPLLLSVKDREFILLREPTQPGNSNPIQTNPKPLSF